MRRLTLITVVCSLLLPGADKQAEVSTLKGNRFGVCALAFAPNGKVLAAGGGGGTLRLWDLQSGMLQEIGRAHV